MRIRDWPKVKDCEDQGLAKSEEWLGIRFVEAGFAGGKVGKRCDICFYKKGILDDIKGFG